MSEWTTMRVPYLNVPQTRGCASATTKTYRDGCTMSLQGNHTEHELDAAHELKHGRQPKSLGTKSASQADMNALLKGLQVKNDTIPADVKAFLETIFS